MSIECDKTANVYKMNILDQTLQIAPKSLYAYNAIIEMAMASFLLLIAHLRQDLSPSVLQLPKHSQT